MDIKSVIKTFAEAWAAASLRLDKSSGQGPGMNTAPVSSMSPIAQMPGLQPWRSINSSPDDHGRENNNLYVLSVLLFKIGEWSSFSPKKMESLDILGVEDKKNHLDRKVYLVNHLSRCDVVASMGDNSKFYGMILNTWCEWNCR